MAFAPAGIPEDVWEASHPLMRELVLEQARRIEDLTAQLDALSSRVAQLEEQKGRSSRNSSKPPSSDGKGFKSKGSQETSKGTGRKRGAQQGHPGSGRELLPSEQCQEVIHHHPSHCQACGEALAGDDPEPLRHQVVEIPPITSFVIEHQLHRLICPHCQSSTCAALPVGVESGGFGPRLSALVGLLGGAYHLSHRKVQGLLDQVLGIAISTGAINKIRCRLSEALALAVEEAAAAIRGEPVVHIDETGGPIGNADGNNPGGKRGWLWVVLTPTLAVFQLALSRCAAVAQELLGESFSGVVISDRYSAYSWLPRPGHGDVHRSCGHVGRVVRGEVEVVEVDSFGQDAVGFRFKTAQAAVAGTGIAMPVTVHHAFQHGLIEGKDLLVALRCSQGMIWSVLYSLILSKLPLAR